jgi:hypothetical protein
MKEGVMYNIALYERMKNVSNERRRRRYRKEERNVSGEAW